MCRTSCAVRRPTPHVQYKYNTSTLHYTPNPLNRPAPLQRRAPPRAAHGRRRHHPQVLHPTLLYPPLAYPLSPSLPTPDLYHTYRTALHCTTATNRQYQYYHKPPLSQRPTLRSQPRPPSQAHLGPLHRNQGTPYTLHVWHCPHHKHKQHRQTHPPAPPRLPRLHYPQTQSIASYGEQFLAPST